MELVLVGGVSGSGKSVALGALEDSGFFAVQNLPPPLLLQLTDYLATAGFSRVAVNFDMLMAGDFQSLIDARAQLQAKGWRTRVIILDAKDDTLVRRFSETRRKHPLASETMKLTEALARERELLRPLADLAAERIDTGGLSSHSLRAWVRAWCDNAATGLSLVFESFGFKFGVPLDADLVFDARLLPNPHYEAGLAALTGQDRPVIEFLQRQPEVGEFAQHIQAFLAKWLAGYQADNRAHLTVAIGCTGGQHRSVYLAESLAAHFRSEWPTLVRHRQIA